MGISKQRLIPLSSHPVVLIPNTYLKVPLSRTSTPKSLSHLTVAATKLTSNPVLVIRAHVTLTTKAKFTSDIDVAFFVHLSALANALDALLVTFPWCSAVNTSNWPCEMLVSYESLRRSSNSVSQNAKRILPGLLLAHCSKQCR